MYLVTSEQMREFDTHAMNTLETPEIVLLDHAGKSVADLVRSLQPQSVVVLAGKGNNGGDGYAAAKWLAHYGYAVHVFALVPVEELQKGAKHAALEALARGVRCDVYREGQPLPDADVYVDALLGTGLSRPATGRFADLLGALREASGTVVSVDVPTGVHPTTGDADELAVRADWTVAVGAEKIGTAVTPGALFAGQVVVADIGIPVPAHSLAHGPVAHWIRPGESWRQAVDRRRDAHKGHSGSVQIAVGEMEGAALLAAGGAARSGAGRVTLVSTVPMQRLIPPDFLAVTVQASDFLSAWHEFAVPVLGPGLGGGFPAESLNQVLTRTGRGVVDADGLRAIRTDVGASVRLSPDVVLTPHPKECGRLLGKTVADIQRDRPTAVRRLAEATECTVILKGYRSLVAHPDGRLSVCETGDASLAVAGTGDVLAGVVAGLMAQGLDGYEAAQMGVWMHGRAGELAGHAYGQAAVMASDVIQRLPAALREATTDVSGSSSDPFGK
ncbi:NAD(P)H-hydrate dehydratase [Alicyclobacillus sp. SP_1]|uniref:NAD(P)H-hydrate dehydratase n=1 Tax=Alicyclobacillus sp. SP_1 TaxID=2942475 RepID=UPI0021584037|nr:NAD(P)H-hydrate dehydratase [Alicyclobacillus sp. SP_1]